MKRTWKVKDKGYCSDEDLVTFIQNGTVDPDDLIMSELLKDYIKVKDSVYAFYLKGENNETL